MTATAFPLAWPSQPPRKQYTEAGAFKTALPAALKKVQGSHYHPDRASGEAALMAKLNPARHDALKEIQ